MCSVAVLRRPSHPWPVLVAANRDEMRDRPSLPPARHWDERPEVFAGQDILAGGTWMGVNDHGVMAAILNRRGTLGPQDGKRSRGELVLEALDHADAVEAARALAHLDGRAYRAFNMVVVDNRDGFWLRNTGRADGRLEAFPIPEGLSLITHADLNDLDDPRIAHGLPRLAAAALPDPMVPASWEGWAAVMRSRDPGTSSDPRAALCFMTERGFGTVSSSLLALPAPDALPAAMGAGGGAVWLYAPGAPDQMAYETVLPPAPLPPTP